MRRTFPVRGLAGREEAQARVHQGHGPRPALRRELGLASATLLVIGGIIGSGIFFTPAETARGLPTGTLVMLVWAAGGVVALAGALTYAELGAMMPDAGGAYVYIRAAFGALPAFLCGWMTLASIASGATAAVAMSFASYLGRFLDLTPVGGALPVAAATIALVGLTNWFGVRPGVAVQNVCTVAKVAAIAALVVGGALAWRLLGAPPSVPAAPPPPPIIPGMAAAFVAVLFTIGGWQQMNMVAGEVRDPDRNIPRALAVGIGVVIACYLGVTAVALRALGRDGLAASAGVAADTAARIAGEAGAAAVTVAVMVSIFGFLNVVVLATPRMFYAMARDGAFFPGAARVHPRWGTPHWSIAILCGWSIALLLLTRGEIGALLSGVVFADWIFFGLGAASVFVLRRRLPDADRPYRVVGYPVVPGFFVAAAAVGVVSAVLSAPRMSALGALLLAAGAAAFAGFRRAHRRVP
ncbi:MAG TPA: amino acid permease [Gemmatimonadaceae bacterium]|nr:amino acid permease [Gemmatimonadaceae bacterium]